MRRAKTHTRPRTAGSGRHSRPLRTTRPLWRIAAGTPQGGAGESYGTITRGLGREPQSRPRTVTDTTLRPYHTRDLTSGGVYHKRPGPRLRRIYSRPVSDLPAWGRYQRPHYTVWRGLVDRPDGAKSAVGMCGPRVTQGPLPVGHHPPRATTVPGVCGPRGPPMAHQKSDEWAIGKPRAPRLKWVSTRNVEKSAPK